MYYNITTLKVYNLFAPREVSIIYCSDPIQIENAHVLRHTSHYILPYIVHTFPLMCSVLLSIETLSLEVCTSIY